MPVLALRYATFAAVATSVNIATQWLTLFWYKGMHALAAAMLAGTATGLAAKYELDRRWIFFDREANAVRTATQFTRYTLTGVITTLVFWGSELGFHTALDAEWAKYVGAGIGLAVGYLLKYRLDKAFVFRGTR